MFCVERLGHVISKQIRLMQTSTVEPTRFKSECVVSYVPSFEMRDDAEILQKGY